MSKNKIYVGLEVGATKTCAAVGEAQPDGSLKILGIGITPSRGVRAGEIIDESEARKAISKALTEARFKTNVDILYIYLALTGSHIKGTQIEESIPITNKNKIVTLKDIQKLKKLAEDQESDENEVIIHNSLGKFSLNTPEGSLVSDPEGLYAETLTVYYHLVKGSHANIYNTVNCVRETPIEIDEIIFSPLASGLHILDQSKRDAGCLLIDIGGGTTDFCLYQKGQPVQSGSIPVGGIHITSDISQILKIPFNMAESLKIHEGDISGDDSSRIGSIIIPATEKTNAFSIERSQLNEIIGTRIAEIFAFLATRLGITSPELKGGIIFTGGSSKMRGLETFAKKSFQTKIIEIYGQYNHDKRPNPYADPSLSTVIGLIRYAQFLNDRLPLKKPSLLARLLSWIR